MRTKRANRYPRSFHGLASETLEPRYCLSSNWNTLLFGPSVSFAPDGVDIAGEPNQLTQTLDAAFPEQDWRSTILSAFQRWSAQANLNVKQVVEEHEFPFGADGHRQYEYRFGNIRIGARPLSTNVKAITIPNDSILSGTWAGDVIFNSAATFDSLDELLAVALHEAGHALGLANAETPNSAMNSAAAAIVTEPSSEDIQAIQELYGAPQPDEYEQPIRNDAIDHAANVPFYTSDDYAGLSVFAELEQDDVDFYRVTIPDCCSDTWSVYASSSGASLLVPEVTIYDGQKNVVAQRAGMLNGDTIKMDLTVTDSGNEYYIRIASPSDEFGSGSYGLSMYPQTPAQETEFTFSNEPRTFVPPPEPEIRELTFFNNVASFTKVRWPPNDLDSNDLFLFSADATDSTTVEVDVASISLELPNPKIQFTDLSGAVIESTVLVNDLSATIVQASLSELPPLFLVRVTPSDGDSLPNYDLDVRFHSNRVTLAPFAQGHLSPQNPFNSHPFQVPVSELNHVSFETEGEGTALALILDADGGLVRSVEAAAGETKTLSGVFLPPGEYQVAVFAAGNVKDLSYSITRNVVSDPFGVTLVEPDDLDFSCPGVAGAFCYPGGIQSDQPGLWDDFLDDQPEKPTVPPAEQPETFLGPWWDWYWNTTQPSSNNPPLAITDQYQSNTSHMLTIDASLGVLANDVDPNKDDLEASILRKPSSGELELHADGSFVYRPFPEFIGEDSFDYLIFDGEHQSQLATVTIDVTHPIMAGDFNADGKVTADDIDIVATKVRDATDMRFDLDQSGTVDAGDLTYMIRTTAIQLGDSNLDGHIDAIDLNVVGKHWQQSVSSWSQGDFNADGIVDASDLNAIARGWAQQAASSHARTPRAPLANDATPERRNVTQRNAIARRAAIHLERQELTDRPQLVDRVLRWW